MRQSITLEMGATQSAPTEVPLRLVAAALTSLIPGSKVITKDDPLYATLEDPKLLTYEILCKNVLIQWRPEPDPKMVLQFDETRDKISKQDSGASLTQNTLVTIQFLNSEKHKFEVDPRATVYALKWAIFNTKEFDEYNEYNVDNIVLTFGKNELNDDDKLTDCGIKDGSVIHFAVILL